ncbi:MAG: amidohydrolase family protein, partial [Gemmatimonadota bacterium]|nr:amidohydrolase family protein [Gemmatimonadota bacterium]
HPRGFGTYPRVLGRYVREEERLTLEEAIHKMTGLAAAHMGFSDRGTLEVGAAADLVLFNPATVIDRATTAEPHLTSIGIERVWVGGTVVYEDGAVTGAQPGVVLRREQP